jgi:hypothetical protein
MAPAWPTVREVNFLERPNREVTERVMGELQSLWSCTVGAPSVSRARNRNPGGWVFRASRAYLTSSVPRTGVA